MHDATGLAAALAIGFLIGIERGWHEREAADGSRVVGIRSFALIGLFGGVCAALGDGAALPVAGLLALALLLGVAWYASRPKRGDYGVTTVIAALLTFAFGALAARGEPALAAAAAVATTVLLGIKAPLHALLRRLQAYELSAALQMLVLAAIVLPLLPRTPLDPWKLISPYEFACLVLLLATLSFAGYAAVRIFGWQRGALLVGAAGGMVSSTAVIASCAAGLRRGEMPSSVATLTMLAACGVMPARVLVMTSLVEPALFPRLVLPSLLMTLPLLPFLRASPAGEAPAGTGVPRMANPLSLWGATQFAAMLVVVLAGVQLARDAFGDRGLLFASAFGGLADVDAISLSLARLAAKTRDIEAMAQGIVIAMIVNTVVKAAIATVLGGRKAGGRVGLALALCVAAGGAVLLARLVLQ